jgi:sulfocyanin
VIVKHTLAAVVCAALLLAPVARADQTLTPDWMKVDAAHKSVALDVVAGWNPNNGALNFNGYYEGDMTVVVPPGWTVKTAVVNHDGMLPHSLLITKPYAKDNIPPEADVSQVAINKAYTDNPVGGLAPNQKDSFTFRTPTEDGSYWMFCGVPGHGVQGMYVDLKVDSKAEKPVVIVQDPKVEGRP